jgi:hypothetical protein
MSPLDAARRILNIFVQTHGLGDGDFLSIVQLGPHFKQPPWLADDCANGIEYAIQQGWIEACGIGTFVLTDAGHRNQRGAADDRRPQGTCGRGT